MANMTFKANLLPDNTGTQKELGSSTARWNIYGDLNGNATTATKLGTANKGSSMQPIYLSSGAPTACTIPSSGAWWSAVPQILSDGVMEVGKYIDFHTTSNGTTDYDVRITAATTGLTISGTTVGTFSGNLSGNATTATTATKLGTDTKGSSTKPIYLSSGAPTECSKYAGGTKVTLNGSSKGSSTASFYAPIAGGTSGYILKSNGSDAPTWLQTLPVANGGTGVTSAADAPWVQKSGDTMTGSLEVCGSGGLYASNGLLKTYCNGNLLTMGSQSNAYCHFYSQYSPFYFNRNIEVDGSVIQYPNSIVSVAFINGRDTAAVKVPTYNNYHAGLSMKTTNGSWEIGVYTSNNLWFTYVPDTQYSSQQNSGYFQTHMSADGKVWGAVYNDYAEMRNVPEAQNEDNPLRPGTCVREVGDGTMVPTTERLQRGCKIISDTFGFNIGETDDCKTPIAVSGRALVYLDQDRENARNYIGWPVCSGPNGTVSIMTEEEEEKYPSRIVGTISEIPDYEKWGSSDVEVNGRIWIYVK